MRGDGHAPQVSLRRVPRPEIAPADPSHREGHVREHPLALRQRQSLGDGGLLRQSRLAFTASSPARVEPPAEPPAPPPTPPAPPPAPGAFAPGGSGRRALGAVLLVLWVFLVAYAVLGYAFTRIYARDDAPASWQWARRWAPFRCDEELAAGGGRGIRGECELLWCWCVPAYWRSSEREAMDAYWAYHPADEP